MKVSEAKTKKCPFIFLADNVAAGVLTYAAMTPKEGIPHDAKKSINGNCIGPKCMMWQWLGDKSGGWCGLTNTGFGGIE